MLLMSYLANLSMFPDCSNTSQTHATCSCVNPNEAIPPPPDEGLSPELGVVAAALDSDAGDTAAAAAALPEYSAAAVSVKAEAPKALLYCACAAAASENGDDEVMSLLLLLLFVCVSAAPRRP